MTAPVESLANVDLLHALTPAERQAIERRCTWRHYAPDEQIIDRETDSSDVYFVASGNVRVVNFSLAGREVREARLRSGRLSVVFGGR